MALQPDTISINLAEGVNNKVDDKIAGPNQTSSLIDYRFDKDKRLKKRYGLTTQSQTFQGDPGFLNPVAFSSGNLKTKTFAHEDQLCVANNGSLFSQDSAQNKWIFKGTYVPLQMTSQQIDASVVFSDVTTVSGVTVAVGGTTVRVIDEATGAIVASNTLSGTEIALKVIGFSSTIYAVTCDTATNNLYARSVSLTTGALGSTVTLASNYSTSAPVKYPSIAITSSGSAIGEAAFILYSATSGNNRVVPFLSSGSVSALGVLTTGFQTNIGAITIEPSVSANKLYVSAVQTDSGLVQAWTFTAGAYTNVYSTNFGVTSLNTNQNITLSLSPIDNATLYVIFDSLFSIWSLDFLGRYNGNFPIFSDEATVKMVSVTSVGVATLSTYGVGYVIGGNAFRDTVRKTIYLPAVYYSPLQSTVLLMDLLEGRATPSTYVVGKLRYGLAATPTRGVLSQASNYSSGKFRFTNGSRIINVDLAPQYAPDAKYLAKTTHLTGGLLWAFDGQNVNEHGFLIGPEQVSVNSQSAAIVLNITTLGDAGFRAAFTFSFDSAVGILAGDYITFSLRGFSGSGTSTYTIWFKVDGSGSDPGLGTDFSYEIDLNSATDSAADVAFKVWNAGGGDGTILNGVANLTGNSVFFRSNVNGTISSPVVFHPFNRTGNLTVSGNYQYAAVFKWIDRNGQIYRSLSSVPQTINIAAAKIAYVEIWAPPITNRTASNIIVEVYRTQANGSEFQLMNSFNNGGKTQLTMSSTSSKVIFYDASSDADFANNEILYTSGGVMENFGIGACSAISIFKNRLITSNADSSSIYYSKSQVTGEPVNFSAFNTIDYNADGENVTAHAQMDDKFVLFKSNSTYVQSGDGSNDLGQSSSFSLPFLIAGDVGCINPASITLYPGGLLFRSNKGTYQLDRSMQVSYIGAPVENYNANTVSSSTLMKSVNEIRITFSDTSTALVYNYFFGRWDFFSNHQSDSACVWKGNFTRASNNGKVWVEGTNYFDTDGSAVPYGLYLETVWLKLRNIQDFGRVYELMFLGEYKSAHTLTVNVSYDYDPITGNSDTYTFDATTIIGGGGTSPGDQTYQFGIGLKRQKCQSIKIKITENPGTGTQEGLVLNDLSAQIGIKPGLNRIRPSKSL